ncbi:hypothetical protein CEUSTIGMA_g7422.t1 [Chlamydomonas eustigma]|uniref:SAM domain-containing protein n=1 Tax=Chlamydomonas eustigma TaxID=1157962 RepID=A0A250XA38_9CHLO|nr:hypothetical protein CEUSTIGMA_g7422.t1 [Chlamydomonas eustigma]|eukprot:GAX79983.1 hypothetical protein CEUSTIGMA_g7422.t1 [Chlamydomonas eustigma]
MATYDPYDADFLARLTVKRLAELNKSRMKVDDIERRASMASEYERERQRLDILNRFSQQYSVIVPKLHDMGLYINELKQYLQSVYDADLLSDPALQTLTSEHCIDYTVKLVGAVADIAGKYENEGSYGVLELAASTLAMFSGRPSAIPSLLKFGAIPAIVTLLSPLFPPVVVINAANSVGNVADDMNARLSFRANGGVGSLVRLLRDDVEVSVQTSAAAALTQVSSLDVVVQDSVRYLGGIDLLVNLLASEDAYLAEVTRLCLHSLRRGNVKNQAEVITSIRSSVKLAKDVRKLDAASELLRFEDGTPGRVPYSAAASAAGDVQSLIDEIDHRRSMERPRTSDSYKFKQPAPYSTYPITPTRLPRSSYGSKSVITPASSIRSAVTRDYNKAVSQGAGLSSQKGASSLRSPSSTGADQDWLLGTSTLVEVESEVLRRKHLSRFSTEEVCLLLEEMGFDRLDLRGFRVAKVDGVRLIGLSESELSFNMVLHRSKVRKIQSLQHAVRTFDLIATLPSQGRISEIELRLFLASQGASSAEVQKVVKLFRTLVRTDRYEFVTFWDFVTSFDWVSQAFRIYNIPY